MPRFIRLSLCCVLLPVLAACGGGGKSGSNTTPDPSVVDCAAGTATLTGTFMTPSGDVPVVGADVTFSGAPGCTASTSGAGSFEMHNVPAAGGTVTAHKGRFTASQAATPGTPALLTIDPTSVAIAYVPGDFDTVENIVTDLGFTADPLAMSDVATTDLASYDLILLDCGLDESYYQDAATLTALRTWIEAGGVVYASDYAAIYVDALYPGKIGYLLPDPYVGADGTQTATIVDETLRRAVGKSTATIVFDLPYWVAIDTLSTGVTELLRGTVVTLESTPRTLPNRPYAAQFTAGTGRVTYTSFHEEGQTVTGDMAILLEQMILGL